MSHRTPSRSSPRSMGRSLPGACDTEPRAGAACGNAEGPRPSAILSHPVDMVGSWAHTFPPGGLRAEPIPARAAGFSTGSTTPSGRPWSPTPRPAVHPRRRRVGQDPGAHPAHRLAGGAGHRPRPARARPHLHPAGGGRARRPAGPARRQGAGGGRHLPLHRLRPAPAMVGRQRRARAGTARPQGPASLAQLSPVLPRRGRPRAGRPADVASRDRVGQGPHGRPPPATRGRRRRGPHARRCRQRHRRRCTSSTSTRSAPAPGRLRRPAAAVRRRPGRRPPSSRAAQRWRFRHLFVDEFQDVNPAPVPAARGLARRPARPLRGR